MSTGLKFKIGDLFKYNRKYEFAEWVWAGPKPQIKHYEFYYAEKNSIGIILEIQPNSNIYYVFLNGKFGQLNEFAINKF